MPLDAKNVGTVARVSPLQTDAILTWTMNFAAAAEVPGKMTKQYYDNTDQKKPNVHPLFLASVSEVIGAWSSLYTAGVTKEEVVKYTFVHYSFDLEFLDTFSINSDESMSTEVMLAGVGQHPAGGFFLTEFKTSNKAGKHIGNSWWGGILLGMKTSNGEKYLSKVPDRPKAKAKRPINEILIEVPPTQAHIWDACIRDPRRPKSSSSDINTHTNLAYAKAGGLPGRTLNGLCALCFALAHIMESYKSEQVKRIGCIFGSPIYLHFDPIKLKLQILEVQKSESYLTVLFQVVTSENKKGIRDGYVVLELSATSKV